MLLGKRREVCFLGEERPSYSWLLLIIDSLLSCSSNYYKYYHDFHKTKTTSTLAAAEAICRSEETLIDIKEEIKRLARYGLKMGSLA